jgi:hypothetical protein
MTAPQVWVECDDCRGTGEITRAVRWAGEAYGELASHLCESCEGDGGSLEDATCLCCEGPLREDGFCPRCEESGLADTSLTETRGDPLLKRRAA